jgi:hypothetical protein
MRVISILFVALALFPLRAQASANAKAIEPVQAADGAVSTGLRLLDGFRHPFG